MNGNDKKIKVATDLGLALGNSHHCSQRRLKDDSGAGANAGSRGDMTFVANNALSELVWSPQKGLSLKCADGSFFARKQSLLWDTGPSNMVTGLSNDKTNTKEYVMTTPGASDIRSEVAGRDDSTKFITSNTGVLSLSESRHEARIAYAHEEETTMALGLPFLQKKENLNTEDRYHTINLHVDETDGTRENKIPSVSDEMKQDVSRNDSTSEGPVVRARDGDGIHSLRTEIVLVSEVRSVKECESYGTKMQKAPPLGREQLESPLCIEKEGEMENVHLHKCPPEVVSSAEYDLKTPHGENAGDMATKIVRSESAHEVQFNFQEEDEILGRDNNGAVKQLIPSNSRNHRHQMKGKGIALSDGNVHDNMVNVEENSCESVESSNSAGLFSTGKKRWSSDLLSCAGRKSIKTEIQESPGSSSFVKQDSSFMNWISNMTKGFLKSNEDEAPSLALAFGNHNHRHGSHDKNLIPGNQNQDQGSKIMGFKSIFQSLYCPKIKSQETDTLNAYNQTEGSKEHELDNRTCDTNAIPIACHMVNCHVDKQCLQSNDEQNEFTSGNGAAPTAPTKYLSINIAACQEINGNNRAENKNYCNLATGKEKDETSSNSSLHKCKKSSAENIDTELPSHGKAKNNSRYKSDACTTLRITRFTPKTAGALSNRDLCNKINGGSLEFFTDNMRPKAQQQNYPYSFHDHKLGVREEEHSTDNPVYMQSCPASTEVSFGFNKVNGRYDENSICKLPFSFRNSDAMASVFARRLDALKHIMPPNFTDDSAHENLACFFCGIKGHQLRDCPPTADSEFEDILRNVSSYNGAEGLPFVCIRCSQSNHWTVACPNASSRTRHQAESGTSLVKECISSKVVLNPRNKGDTKQSNGKDSQFQAADASKVCHGKLLEAISHGEKGIASSSGEKKLKENQVTPLSNFFGSQISDIPERISDIVKKLRLSRTDILKWMNSDVPLSHLDGFFLRLRLRKWEQRLGGTGYYVGCITGVQSESSTQKSRFTLAVNVGGVKCLVESQYVSNHDFTEDELLVWWSTNLKGGSKLPSEEDLRMKVKQMKMLGF